MNSNNLNNLLNVFAFYLNVIDTIWKLPEAFSVKTTLWKFLNYIETRSAHNLIPILSIKSE